MARLRTIRVMRGTRAQLNAAAAANGLLVGEPYLITDEGRLAWGTATNAYRDSGPRITVSDTAPASPAEGDLWIDTSA